MSTFRSPYDRECEEMAEIERSSFNRGHRVGYEAGRCSILKIVDDIKSEIKNIISDTNNITNPQFKNFIGGLDKALDIIDKHIDDFHYDGETDIKSISTPTGITFDNYKVLEDIKTDFTSCYPKNVYGELELGGRSCVFSLNKIFEILNKHTGKRSE